MAFANTIESPWVDYQGTMDATTWEYIEPNVAAENPSRLIRDSQPWYIQVDWEMHGVAAESLDAKFHLRAYLDVMGPGADMTLPLPPNPDVTIDTYAGTLTYPGGKATRTYSARIDVAAGTVPVGSWKLVTVLQLRSNSPAPVHYPIAGLVEGPVLDVFHYPG